MVNDPTRILHQVTKDYAPLSWDGKEWGFAAELFSRQVDYSDFQSNSPRHSDDLRNFPVKDIYSNKRFFDVCLFPRSETGTVNLRGAIDDEVVTYRGNISGIPLTTIGDASVIYGILDTEKNEIKWTPKVLQSGETFPVVGWKKNVIGYLLFNPTDLVQVFKVERKLLPERR